MPMNCRRPLSLAATMIAVSAGAPLVPAVGRQSVDVPPHPPALATPIKIGDRPLPVPTPPQAAWHDREVGMFIHMAPQTWQDSEVDKMTTPLSAINPDKLDTEQWARVAESMGAKSIVFVAKHEGGFCWWPTETNDYSVKSIPWRGAKGDVLEDLSESCRKHGLKLGVYLSPQDRKHDAVIGGRTKDPAKQADYQKMFRAQLTEVLSRYGEMSEVWFDGSLVFDVGDILQAHAPNAVVFQGPQATIRWVGNEDGVVAGPAWNCVKSGKYPWGDYTGADGDPDGDRWAPNECDARIRATWFWRTDNQATLKTVPQLMDMYEKSVGRGAVLLLNLTPDRSGRIPEADATRAAEFGEEIERRYGHPSTHSMISGREAITVQASPIDIDRVMVSEDITQGERVRKFVVEGMVDGNWKTMCEGTAIGHKRIIPLPRTKVENVRLRVTEAIGEPLIRRFAVFEAISP